MAVATAPSLNRHFLRRPFSGVKKRRPWLLPGGANLFDSRRNRDSHLLVFASSPFPNSRPAESCVNTGLDLFKRGRVKDALVQFETALTLDPNPIESQAAYYNRACCHAYRGEGNKAADCLRVALRDYNLKFATILNDPDLASFRALPEFKQLQEEEDFDTRTQSVVAQSKLKSEIRFKSEVVSPGEWERWIRDQQIAEGVVPGEDVYIILRLDGRVRRSGKGMPDWAEISKELPPMNDVLSKLER
ncbi:hypothetical protein F2Q68_00038186 [Brassica cretica]|uniref:Uncharacterized protein n=1 Tax=Brassica cretica TaxID=69181 RepID=A0A8S9MN11_BRACR|nr:hypothetical protein F2Q68_00038186 [Brassica cretica]